MGSNFLELSDQQKKGPVKNRLGNVIGRTGKEDSMFRSEWKKRST